MVCNRVQGLSLKLEIKIKSKIKITRGGRVGHGLCQNVTGWHGSCHGWGVRKGPSLLICHGVTGLNSEECRVGSVEWGNGGIRDAG